MEINISPRKIDITNAQPQDLLLWYHIKLQVDPKTYELYRYSTPHTKIDQRKIKSTVFLSIFRAILKVYKWKLEWNVKLNQPYKINKGKRKKKKILLSGVHFP